MALVSLTPSHLVWPGLTENNPNNPSAGAALTLDAAGEYVCNMMFARENMTISHVIFKCATATGSPTADVRIETVDASTALPTGTLWAANTNVISGTLTSNAMHVVALTASASITAGQAFAVKTTYNSGTSWQPCTTIGAPIDGWAAVNTGTPTVQASAYNIGVGSSSTSFYPLKNAWPITTAGSTNFNNTSSGRRGMKFRTPFACRVAGMRCLMPNSATGDFSIGLWDTSNAEVGSTITAYDRSSFTYGNATIVDLLFDTPATISANTDYYIAVRPDSATNCNIYHCTIDNAAYRSSLPGGTNVNLATYASGTWTDTTTTIPLIDILIDQVDDGAGSGGGASFSAYAS